MTKLYIVTASVQMAVLAEDEKHAREIAEGCLPLEDFLGFDYSPVEAFKGMQLSNEVRELYPWGESADNRTVSDILWDMGDIEGDIAYQRGLADGRRGHPPAELTQRYVLGYDHGVHE